MEHTTRQALLIIGLTLLYFAVIAGGVLILVHTVTHNLRAPGLF